MPHDQQGASSRDGCSSRAQDQLPGHLHRGVQVAGGNQVEAPRGERDRQVVALPLDRLDRARGRRVVGGTRQSVNKLLSGLVGDGLVRIERDALVITDVEGLARRAER